MSLKKTQRNSSLKLRRSGTGRINNSMILAKHKTILVEMIKTIKGLRMEFNKEVETWRRTQLK